MEINVMEVTPALAAEWLKKNASNRRIRSWYVTELADAMTAGMFQTTHQGVALNPAGELIDGQHRLLAVVKSGVTVTMPVATNVNAESYRMLMVDVGRGRSTADVYATDRQITEPCAFIANLHSSIKNKAFLGTYLDAFGPLVAAIIDGNKGRRASVTASPVVAAAVVRVAMGEDVEYIRTIYSGMVGLDYDTLPPVANAYLRQVANGVVNSHQQVDMFVRAMSVFNIAAQKNAKIQVKNSAAVLAKVRDFITRFLSTPELVAGVHARITAASEQRVAA